MKTKLSVLLLLCVTACSHTPSQKPSPVAFEDVSPAPPATMEAAAPAAPVTTVTETNPPLVEVDILGAPQPPIVPGPGSVAAASNAVPSPFGRPPQPSVPAMPQPRPSPAGATPGMVTREEIISAGLVDFRGADLASVLQLYCQMVNRTLLRPQALPDAKIYLKNQTELTKTEMIQAFDAVLGLNGITMLKIGDKFVKAVPVGQANIEAAPFSNLEATELPELGSYVSHVVQLKYAKPSEMVQILQPFAKIPNSILPVESSQILVLRDYTENVKRMLEMINKVDIAIPAEFESEVIPIKYALAVDISSALNSLSAGGSGATVGSSGGGGRSGGLGGGIGGGIGGGGGMGGRTGIGGTGQPGSQGNYPGGINRQGGLTPGGGGLNPGGGAAPGPGGSFTERLRNIIQRASTSGEFQILGQTKIIADERTNSLLIFASHADMEMIRSIVAKLDVVLAQVLIEAIIMEVSLDNSRNLGVSIAQSKKGLAALGGANNGASFFPFNGATGGTNDFPANLGAGLNYFGRFNTEHATFNLAIQALAADGRVNVLSRPRIQTSHGVEADLFVGQTVPYITGTTFNDFGGGGSRSQYQEKQIGITLKVKPLINPDGLVVMDIYQEIGQPGATPVTIDGNPVPIINQRQAQATVAVKDHDTIILGGMIGTTKNKTRSGVPYLKDIPLLGALFRSTSDSEQRTELIVLLRPTVLPTPEAAAVVANTERMNLPGVRRAEAEIHEEEARRLKQAEKELDQKKDLNQKNPVPAPE